jgi:tetratricopeptide (TPR) repeat protein
VADAGQVLEQAKAYHRAGQLSEAERCYRQVLASGDAHPHTLYLLAAICHSLGRAGEAVDLLRQSIQLQPAYADSRHLLGAVLVGQGQWEPAVAELREALRLNPQSADIERNLRAATAGLHCARGLALEAEGRLAEAAASYRQAIVAEPTYIAALGNLGNVFKKQNNWAEAEACYKRVLELAPGAAQAHNDLGHLAQLQGRLGEAVEHYQRAIAAAPNFAEAHTNLGTALLRAGHLEQAASACRRAVELNPNSPEAHADLGAVLKQQGRIEEARASCRTALRLNPDFVEGHNNLGVVLAELDEFDEAVRCYRRALQLRPQDHASLFNLAQALTRQNAFDEAESVCRQAVAVRPSDPQTHFLLAVILLTQGKLTEGFAEYQWRCHANPWVLAVPAPCWDGSSLEGETILLRCEQGYGDAIQFLRYAPLLKARGARVAFECPKPLARLATRAAGVDEVVVEDSERPVFKFQLPLLSLPAIFETTLETIPTDIPYLSADATAAAEWGQELRSHPGLKVGIAWQGNPTYQRDYLRSISLKHFLPLAIPGVQLISLQHGEGSKQLHALLKVPILDFGDRLGDFHDTAAIVSNLDLVISSDCGVAHLAGALGTEVWLALPWIADWRWLRERTDSPWYPSMRLFRQQAPGDWADVFERMRSELLARAQSNIKRTS